MNPPVNGLSKFLGNKFNHAEVPPNIINFPIDYTVKICFKSGKVVNGNLGFRAEMSEKRKTTWISSPNYPEDINDNNYMEKPPEKYGPNINHCWIRCPSKGKALELEFVAFDVGWVMFALKTFYYHSWQIFFNKRDTAWILHRP